MVAGERDICGMCTFWWGWEPTVRLRVSCGKGACSKALSENQKIDSFPGNPQNCDRRYSPTKSQREKLLWQDTKPAVVLTQHWPFSPSAALSVPVCLEHRLAVQWQGLGCRLMDAKRNLFCCLLLSHYVRFSSPSFLSPHILFSYWLWFFLFFIASFSLL